MKCAVRKTKSLTFRTVRARGESMASPPDVYKQTGHQVTAVVIFLCISFYALLVSPWRIVDDCGGAFTMGAIGGGVFQSIKGFRNAPVVSLDGSLRYITNISKQTLCLLHA